MSFRNSFQDFRNEETEPVEFTKRIYDDLVTIWSPNGYTFLLRFHPCMG